MIRIKIITKDGCVWSSRMRSYLDKNNLEYLEYKESSPLTLEKIKNLDVSLNNLPRNVYTFPAVFLDNIYIGGYSQSRYIIRKRGLIDNES